MLKYNTICSLFSDYYNNKSFIGSYVCDLPSFWDVNMEWNDFPHYPKIVVIFIFGGKNQNNRNYSLCSFIYYLWFVRFIIITIWCWQYTQEWFMLIKYAYYAFLMVHYLYFFFFLILLYQSYIVYSFIIYCLIIVGRIQYLSKMTNYLFIMDFKSHFLFDG